MKISDIDKIELVFIQNEDYQSIKEVMVSAYSTMPDSYWTEDDIKRLLRKFPDGQVVIKVNDQVAGCALSIIVDSKECDKNHTYNDITANDTFESHKDNGDVLYGIDIFIKPEFRGLRLGRRLYDYRKELCEKLNLRGIAFGGRIPNYYKYSKELSPKQYIEKVKRKEINDPVLNFQISNDFHPSRILKGYLNGDANSKDFAVLLKWDNIYFERQIKKASIKKKVVRLGLIQWQMRSYDDVESLLQQAEYFVDAVSGYRADFALFPEFFNAPLMAKNNHMSESEAIRELSSHTP